MYRGETTRCSASSSCWEYCLPYLCLAISSWGGYQRSLSYDKRALAIWLFLCYFPNDGYAQMRVHVIKRLADVKR